jgi:thiamine-monophosphate kinase
MIDVSDGIGCDISHILKESGLSGEIVVDQLPAIPGIIEESTWMEYVINGGEDYCLVGTCDPDQSIKIQETYPTGFPPLRFIGRIYEGQPSLSLIKDGKKLPYLKKGYDHFR